MLFKRGPGGETQEQFERRMEGLMEDWRQLMQRTPEEVAGDPFEPIYYQTLINSALKEGTPEEVRQMLEWTLRRFPLELGVRLAASLTYLHLGDEAEAIAQLGILLALDPTYFAAHHFLARLLRSRGDEQAAERVLENGWCLAERHYPRKEREAERQKWFRRPEPPDGA